MHCFSNSPPLGYLLTRTCTEYEEPVNSSLPQTPCSNRLDVEGKGSLLSLLDGFNQSVY